MPVPARVMSPATWIELYVQRQRAQRRREAHPRAAGTLAPDGASQARLDAAARRTGGACHSDLHRLNLVDSGRVVAVARLGVRPCVGPVLGFGRAGAPTTIFG